MRGCGFIRLTQEEVAKLWLEAYDDLPREERVALDHSDKKGLRAYGKMARAIRSQTTKLKKVKS